MRAKLLVSLLFVGVATLWGCQDRAKTSPSTEEVAEKPAEAPAGDEEAPEEPAAEPEEAPAEVKPLLYEVRTAEHGSIYLLGTIHMGFDAEKELPQWVWDRFDSAEVFVMETDLTQAQASMLASAALPEGQSLEEMLGPEMWEALDERLGGVANQFKSVKPWFVVSMLILKMMPEASAITPMDQLFHQKARAQGKELAYLERPQEQLEILDKTLTVDELKEMLREFDEQKKELADMLRYYREGNIAGLEELSFTDLEEKPEMYETLFFKRNEAWVPKIEGHIERGNVFIAFGAGHLLGDRGVLELLEARGYEPVRLTAEAARKQAENEENATPPQ